MRQRILEIVVLCRSARKDGRLGAGVGLVGLVMSLLGVGSGKMCSEAPFGIYKEQYTVHMLRLFRMVDYDPARAFVKQESEADFLLPCRISGFILI